MEPLSITTCIELEDPLSVEVLPFLADYREEDHRIDYKEQFHFNDEKEWLEITKDVMAFANTFGGYLLFGIRDGTYEVSGLDTETRKILLDVNNFQQKINRFVDPPILQLRSKDFTWRDQIIVAMYIPRLVGRTNVVSKDGKFKYPSGEEKQILHKGTIYVRRSGGNHLADARDIDDLVGRRIDEFKHSLLNKIARVVEAPAQSEIFVLSSDPSDTSGKKYIIDDGPNAVAVKGMSFTVAPKTPEQEVSGWIAILQRTPDTLPPYSVLWQWYAQREKICLTPSQKLAVARFSLLSGLPVFYWIRGVSASKIRPIIVDTITRLPVGRTETIMRVAAFFGKKFHDTLARKISEPRRRMSSNARHYPEKGPRSLLGADLIQAIIKTKFKVSEKDCSTYVLKELNDISSAVDGSKVQEPDDENKWLATVYDCYLYAQDDKYSQPADIQEEENESVGNLGSHSSPSGM